MDTESFIMGAVLLIICVAPFAITYLKNNKKESQFIAQLNQLAQAKDVQIDHYELFGNMIFAIDKTHKKALFLQNIGANENLHVVDLQKSVLEIDMADLQDGKRKNIQRITFEWKSSNHSPHDSWVIYDGKKKFQLSGELELIKKWQNIYKDVIAS